MAREWEDECSHASVQDDVCGVCADERIAELETLVVLLQDIARTPDKNRACEMIIQRVDNEFKPSKKE